MFKVFYAVNLSAMLDPIGYASTGDFSTKYDEVIPHTAKHVHGSMGEVYERFNTDIPETHGIRSMSVGDVLESLVGDRYVCDVVGFTKISSPPPKPTWAEMKAKFKDSIKVKQLR